MPEKMSSPLSAKIAGKISESVRATDPSTLTDFMKKMWRRNLNPNMRGLADIGPGVPAFLVKLWKIVEDPEIQLINWSQTGMSFIIRDQARFAREILPMHYKHNNMASFIRQLNMYDFHKISSLESGTLRNDRDELEFAHQYFIRDHPYLLENIKRKMSNPRPAPVAAAAAAPAPPPPNPPNDNARNVPQPDIFSRLLSDVNLLKGKQDTWDARLSAMKRENEALWRELAVFRQKHLKQEQIINRLIHFIVTIVQPNRKVPIPRRFPLMLNDTNQIRKIPRVNITNGSSSRASPPGPTIHEIEGDVLINGNEISEPSIITTTTADGGFITARFSDNPNNITIIHSEPEISKDPVLTSSASPPKRGNPSDWLEIVLTEDDMITPLTPVDPAEVNPVVAAATLKHMENNNKVTVPVTMKIPAIVTSDGNQRRVPEKKIIYLAEIDKPEKALKKKQLNSQYPKSDEYNNKGMILPNNNNISIIETDDDDDAVEIQLPEYDNTTISKILTTVPSNPKSFTKRKLSLLSSPTDTPTKRQLFEENAADEAASQPYSPLPTPNTLDSLLNCNLIEAITDKDNTTSKDPAAEDSFWRLESLCGNTLNVDELMTNDADGENPVAGIIEEVEDLPVNDNDKTPEINISDICANDVALPKPADKNDEQTSDALVGFVPESMAVVCQTQSAKDNKEGGRQQKRVKGNINYIKEVMKDGYNFDYNNLFEYFNEDPLSYGLLQTTDEEPKEKEDEQVVTGNEIMAYGGTPNNLMELVDLFGSTGTVQDWSNITAPSSPAVSDLVTPISSPSPANLAKSGKRRKI